MAEAASVEERAARQVVVDKLGEQSRSEPTGSASACANCGRLERELQECERKLESTQRSLQEAREQEARLQAQLADLQRSTYGQKSEGTPPGEGEDPPGSRSAADRPPVGEGSGADSGGKPEPAQGAHGAGAGEEVGGKPRRGRGRKPGSPTPPRVRHSAPVKDEELDVPEAERCCPDCGTPYRRNGYKVSLVFEIDLQAVGRRLLRWRYRPACDCSGARPVTAPGALRLGCSQLGVSVWAWIVVQVYGGFRTQAGVARDLLALGLQVPASTLSAGVRRLSKLFEPLDAAIARHQRQAGVAQADETRWPVQYIGGREEDSRAPSPRGRRKLRHWLWICLAGNAVRMRILPTRSLEAALQLLRASVLGGVAYLMCDRYSVCKALARRFPDRIVLVCCWSHVRRDYVRVGTGHAELQGWSQAWVGRIGELFRLHRLWRQAWRPERPPEEQSAEFEALRQQLEARLQALFETAAEEVWERMIAWTVLSRQPDADGAGLASLEAQGKALASLLRHREGLSRFVSDPRIPLDNNAAERALRGPVIARHTSFGSGGPDGAWAAGLMFGVLGTWRLAGLHLCTVVLDCLGACARHGGRPPEDLDAWLLWRMSEERRRELEHAPRHWWPPTATDPGAAQEGAGDGEREPLAQAA